MTFERTRAIVTFRSRTKPEDILLGGTPPLLSHAAYCYTYKVSLDPMGPKPLRDAIADAYDRGVVVWRAVECSPERFVERAVALGVSVVGLQDWSADFYLACAAGHGNQQAIAIVNERFVDRLAGRIRRLGAKSDDVPDVLQVIREHLFTGQRPRIHAYNASGPLEQWIKVVAIRAAIDIHRAKSRNERIAIASEERGRVDLADTLFRSRYRAEFQEVLRAQILALPNRDRVVLRLHLIEGVSIESIAAARGVHRVTVARWIWNAGEALLEGLHRYFKEKYDMVPSECQSLAHLLQSQLSLDLPRLLAS